MSEFIWRRRRRRKSWSGVLIILWSSRILQTRGMKKLWEKGERKAWKKLQVTTLCFLFAPLTAVTEGYNPQQFYQLLEPAGGVRTHSWAVCVARAHCCSWEHECWPPATAGSPLALAANGYAADTTRLLGTGTGGSNGSRADFGPEGNNSGNSFQTGTPHTGRSLC